MAEWYCLVNKEKYGPVSETELQQWISDGRLGPEDYIVQPGMTEWVKIASVPQFMALTAQGHAAASGAQPDGMNAPVAAGVQGQYEPHRGATVLTLGIIGVVCCCILVCGIIATVMGSRDLKKMNAGVMDPEGRGNTQAGFILGIIGTVIGSLVILYYMVVFVLTLGMHSQMM